MSRLDELEEALSNSFYDKDGWFSRKTEPERYVRYLEMVNEEWAKEATELRETLEKKNIAIQILKEALYPLIREHGTQTVYQEDLGFVEVFVNDRLEVDIT